MQNSNSKDAIQGQATIAANPLLPAVAVMPIRNFQAKLPDDFFQLLSIELKRKPKSFLRRNKDGVRKRVTFDNNLRLPFITEMEAMRYMHGCYADNRMFRLSENNVVFSGRYSKWLIVKWCQKLKERFAPEMAIIKYVDYKTAIDSDPKLKERYDRMVSVALSHSR